VKGKIGPGLEVEYSAHYRSDHALEVRWVWDEYVRYSYDPDHPLDTDEEILKIGKPRPTGDIRYRDLDINETIDGKTLRYERVCVPSCAVEDFIDEIFGVPKLR
jgi:hypothetical protein